MANSKGSVSFPLINVHAAGIDIGSRSNWVCVGEGKDKIREFGVFTEDHYALAQWLQSHEVTTIAMESTGIYWKSIFLILQAYGFEVLLVNATHVKNVRGKKTDMLDCHWIWQLHRAGLLTASFQPDEITEELRTYNRHRKSLIEGAARCISRMQKSLLLMNIQLSIVISDITGKSGQAIIKAILEGQRDGEKLAKLADPRIRASREEITKALTGKWHKQQLFTLKQSWDLYQFQGQQIQECDQQIAKLLEEQAVKLGRQDLAYQPVKKKRPHKNAPKIDLGKYAYQLSNGVDLMQIDGVSYNLVLTLIAEVGLDLHESFKGPKNFTSWMGLSPNKRITGGKTISSRTMPNKNRIAQAFRQAANTIGRQKDTPLADFFRRIAFKKGRKVAITATARKLAVIVYNMLVKKQDYNPDAIDNYRQTVRLNKIKYIHKTIKKLRITPDELVFS